MRVKTVSVPAGGGEGVVSPIGKGGLCKAVAGVEVRLMLEIQLKEE
jgi:hypothetical protein